MNRPTKIHFGELRAQDCLRIVIGCADPKCSHSRTISTEPWADDVRLSDIEN